MVERRLTYSHLAGNLLDRNTLFGLPQGKGNILLCEPRILHALSPFENEILTNFSHFEWTSFRGADHLQMQRKVISGTDAAFDNSP
jgi:hypothetical protein